jgi:hypothetical protein
MAHLAQGGVTWEMKGQKGVLDDVFVTARLHEEQVSHWPGNLAGLSMVLTIYAGEDGLIRREDYDVEIMGDSAGAHYMSGYTRIAGIMVPTRHRILPRAPEGQALTDPLLISIDLSEIALT